MKTSFTLIIILNVLLGTSFTLYAQFDCMTSNDTITNFQEKSYLYCNDPYAHLNNYLLDKRGANLYDHSPIYTINVKVHVIQYSLADPRNYTEIDTAYIRQSIEDVNYNFAHLQPPTIPVISPSLEETDSRIKFRLKNIDFIQDTLGWAEILDMEPVNASFKILNSDTIRVYNLPADVRNHLVKNRACLKIQNSISNDGNYMYKSRISGAHPADSIDIILLNGTFNNIYDQSGTLEVRGAIDRMFYSYNKYHQNDPNFLHIYFVRNTSECFTNGFGQAESAPSNALRMVTPGNSTIHLSGSWEVGIGILSHELGHCLGLYHIWDTDSHSPYVNDLFHPDDNLGWFACNTTTISNNIMGYNTCRNYLSPMQIADVRRIMNSYPVIKNTVAELNESTQNDVFITTPDVVWEKYEMIGSVLYIESGAKLTIKCRVQFSPDAKVVIKPGGKLIIDGGLLTNGSSQHWKGVEVWGTSSQNQYPDGNPTYQGYLQLINGGTIENAHIAATNWKSEDFDKIGGVIVSNGGVFKNNRRDLVFMSYENSQPGNPSIKKRDLSNFSNTEFKWDNNFMELGLAIQPMVTMWNVHGINYTNCHFSNNRTGSGHKAIYSIDASYTVNAGCTTSPPFGLPCPTANLLKSAFTGFTTAVEASGAGTTKVMKISQAKFENNLTGVSIQEFDNVSIDRNSIKLGLAGNVFVFGGSGIVIDNSTGYIIEENSISTIPQISLSMGVYVNNSGTANNRLYKNSLNGLYIGNYPTGINRDANNALKGLQFLCNTYTSNSYAIFVGSSASADGVRLYQGEYSPLKSAGNVFNSNTSSIYNSSTWPISYYHNGGTTIPTNNTANVTLYNAGTANACKSSFGGLIFFKQTSSSTLDSLENEVQNMQTAFDELNYNYLSLLDGGNTQQLQSQIENNWSEDAWKLRAKLLEKTPYLSQGSLLEAAKQNILPNAMLLEICLANPDATKGVYFSQKLNDATDNSFPEYMQEYIKGNWDSKTIRSTLEAKMASLQSELGSTRSFIKHIKASADDYTIEDRFAMVSSGKELSDKINLMDYFIENSQWLKADSVLQAIQNDKKWEDNLELVKDFDTYISFRSSLGSRTIAQLNESEIDALMTLAKEKGRVAGYAQNILCFFYQICYDEQPDGGTTKMMIQQPDAVVSKPTINELMYDVTIYPNPAAEYTSLKWEIYDELQSCQYQVFDLNGILVSHGEIIENKGEKMIDTRPLLSGIYIVSITNSGEIKATKKIVVKHEK